MSPHRSANSGDIALIGRHTYRKNRYYLFLSFTCYFLPLFFFSRCFPPLYLFIGAEIFWEIPIHNIKAVAHNLVEKDQWPLRSLVEWDRGY